MFSTTSVMRFVRRLPMCLSMCAIVVLLVIGRPAEAQNHQVSGTVTSAEMAPLLGVGVVVQGTTIGTITNASGSYTLIAPSATATLVFSALGMRTLEVPIGGRNVINVTLETQAIALEDMVVVGYGVQSRASLSGAVSQVTSEDLTRTSGTNTTSALVGKMQGITSRAFGGGGNATSDARPGGTTAIQIRNLGDPLIVIDGVPYDYMRGDPPGRDRTGQQRLNPLDNLNPADIESISILKDASASVYGFRAANGVVLVTTKSGTRNQAPRVSIDGYYGIQNLTRFPFDPPANAYEFQTAWVESEQNLRQSRSITKEELELWRIGAPGYESFNQKEVVINRPNAPQYNLNANVSGGAENATYYLSIGHVKQDWAMLDNSFNRTNLQANVQADLSDRLRIGVQLSGGQENRDNVAVAGREDPVFNMTLGTNSSWPMDNPWANGNRDYVNGDVRFLARLGSTFRRDISGFQEDRRRNATGNFFVESTLPLGIQARATYSHTLRQTLFERQRFNVDAYCYDAATDTYNVCATLTSALRNKERRDLVQQAASIRFNRNTTFGAHTLSGVLALEVTGSEDNFVAVQSVPPSNFSQLINFVEQNSLDNTWQQDARQSVAGRFNYDYSQKYLVEVLGRYDGSYLYAPDNRWGFFPGVSVAWRPTQEEFLMDRLSFLDDLKLRLSWGQTGREQGVNQWGYLEGATYGVGNGSIFDGSAVTGVRPRGLPVTNISWVTSTSRNVGVDFVLFRNRISAEVDAFERRLTGLPAARYDVLLPNEVGFSLPNENLESESHRGLEAMVTFSDQLGGLAYSISAHSTVSRRRILDRYKPRYASDWDKYVSGDEHRWQGVDFQYKVIGRFESWEDIDTYPINNDLTGNRTQLPGDLKFEDVNGDGIINALDQRPLGFGTSQPPIWMYGFNTKFQHSGITLNVDWSGGAMYSWVQGVESKVPLTANHNSQKWMLTDRWHQADPYDDRSPWIPGRYPAIRRGQSNHNNLQNARGGDSDFFRNNVWYMRLKHVELGYDLRGLPGLTQRLGIASGRIYTSVSNPFSFDNLKRYSMDPEMIAGNGILYPTQRVTNVGFSANLGGATRAPAPVLPVPPTDADN
jgi:TonB-linked SusC/RagA family outer membrane protein